jgi:hypothetical protein
MNPFSKEKDLINSKHHERRNSMGTEDEDLH